MSACRPNGKHPQARPICYLSFPYMHAKPATSRLYVSPARCLAVLIPFTEAWHLIVLLCCLSHRLYDKHLAVVFAAVGVFTVLLLLSEAVGHLGVADEERLQAIGQHDAPVQPLVLRRLEDLRVRARGGRNPICRIVAPRCGRWLGLSGHHWNTAVCDDYHALQERPAAEDGPAGGTQTAGGARAPAA